MMAPVFGLTLALAVVVTACSRKSESEGKGQRSGAAVPVLAALAISRDVPVEIQNIGQVQAYSLVAVRPQITGPIMRVHFQEGQEVKAGDLLFTIDPRPWEAAVNQAQANLKRDEAQMINARLTFERTSNLFVSQIASQQDFDTAEANYDAARSTVVADHAAIMTTRVYFDYTAIRAPITGRTGNLLTREGNVVKAPDDTLVTIAQIRPIYVAFSVPEHHLATVRRRANEETLRVQAFAPGDTNQLAWGELTFIDNTVDTNTGTFLLKGTFANTDSVLWPGQFVQTTLTVSNLTQATLVPSQAVQAGQNGEFVFVVKSGDTVEARPVVAGMTWKGMRVIQSGVGPGEVVVTDGQLRLTPGAKVSVKMPEGTGPPTNTVSSRGTR
jgi:membrane fusion protein, multidrug efflux system